MNDKTHVAQPDHRMACLVLRRRAGVAEQLRGDKMKLIAILIAAAVLLPAAARAECLSSARAVRAEHGVGAWSTWRNVDGRKCWMVGERHGIYSHIANNRSHSSSNNHASHIKYSYELMERRGAAKEMTKCDHFCRQQLYQEFKGWYYFEGLYGRAK
jgi:hypothetical protein